MDLEEHIGSIEVLETRQDVVHIEFAVWWRVLVTEDTNRSQPSTDDAAKPTSAAQRGTENRDPRSQNT